MGEGVNTYSYTGDGRRTKLMQQWNSDYATSPAIGTSINTANLNQTKITEYIGNIVWESKRLPDERMYLLMVDMPKVAIIISIFAITWVVWPLWPKSIAVRLSS